MDAKLKRDKYSDFEFVKRTIKSCKTFTQLRSPITKLIKLFKEKHKDFELTDLLSTERNNHKLYPR